MILRQISLVFILQTFLLLVQCGKFCCSRNGEKKEFLKFPFRALCCVSLRVSKVCWNLTYFLDYFTMIFERERRRKSWKTNNFWVMRKERKSENVSEFPKCELVACLRWRREMERTREREKRQKIDELSTDERARAVEWLTKARRGPCMDRRSWNSTKNKNTKIPLQPSECKHCVPLFTRPSHDNVASG